MMVWQSETIISMNLEKVTFTLFNIIGLFYNERFNLAKVEPDSSQYKIGYVKGYKNMHKFHSKTKPKYVFIKDSIFKNEDSTFDFDFIHKYFGKHELDPSLYKERKELLKDIYKIKNDAKEQMIDIEELDVKYSNKKVKHHFNVS